MKRIFSLSLALLFGSAGGMFFLWLGMPAPWLSGAMVGVTFAVLLGIPCDFPKEFNPGLFVVLGLSMGSGVKPETLSRVHQWPISMVLIFFTVLLIILSTYLYAKSQAGTVRPPILHRYRERFHSSLRWQETIPVRI